MDHNKNDGHPSQAHADHAVIMKAHGIINHPERMAAVHELHGHSEGLMDMLKRRSKEVQSQFAGEEAKEPAHDESHETMASEKAEKDSSGKKLHPEL